MTEKIELPDGVKVGWANGKRSPGFPLQADHMKKTAAIVDSFATSETAFGLDDRARAALDGVRTIRQRREEAMKAFAEEENELLLQCITAVVDPLCARVGVDLWTLIDILKDEANRRSPERKEPTQ